MKNIGEGEGWVHRMPDAATNITVSPVHDQPASAWDALPYLYLLRVQLITFLALLSFPFIALWFAPNLLLGLFDVMPWGMVFVTLGAALASWTVMVTAWQVFFYGPGFQKDGISAHEGHYLALWSFLLCFLVYVAIGIGKFFRIGNPPTVPTLADLLVFLMILCWGLSAVTFILDRFRIPLLLPFLLAAIVSAHVHATDHYFYMFSAKSSLDLSPAQVIRAGKPGSAVIVVAASGGGIKAAAWTTRVLTGLEESNP